MTKNYELSLLQAIQIILLFTIAAFTQPASPSDSTKKMVVHFFGSSHCGECNTIKNEILKPLAEKYPDRLNIRTHDIENEQAFQLMMKMEEQYNVTESSPQELFLPDTALLGFEQIMTDGERMIEDYFQSPKLRGNNEVTVDSSSFQEDLRERFQSFTFIGILAAGLVDGVNPCAVATMIFLISFLATQKRKRSEILAIGISFTAAVYVTYLLLGIGAFNALTMLEQYHWVSQVVRWSAVGLAGIIAGLSFRDAISFKQTGKTDSIKLQLPKPIKMRIHRVISGNLKSSQLVTGAMITGFLVTLLEAVCTGQVYLPTIILMTKNAETAVTGWLYLLFYNFLFVLPLLVVMILAYFGLTWNRLAKTAQKNLSGIKVLLGIVMIALAVFLAIA